MIERVRDKLLDTRSINTREIIYVRWCVRIDSESIQSRWKVILNHSFK